MMNVAVSPFLRNVLLADAAISGAAGALMIAGAGLLGPLLALPEPLLFWAGIVLVPYVALLLALARRAAAPRLFLMDVVLINGLWAAASFGILLSGAVAPNLLGTAFVGGPSPCRRCPRRVATGGAERRRGRYGLTREKVTSRTFATR